MSAADAIELRNVRSALRSGVIDRIDSIGQKQAWDSIVALGFVHGYAGAAFTASAITRAEFDSISEYVSNAAKDPKSAKPTLEKTP